MGQPDSIRLVHAKIANVFGTIDPNHAAIALTYALAGIGMSGSSLLVVLNSLRLQKSERP